MASGLRETLEGPAGKIAAAILIIVGLGAAFWSFRNSFSEPSAVADANSRVYIDASTGKSFSVDLKAGVSIPLTAPSGGKTGFPAEACYWTADGKAKNDPTYVLLNDWVNKPGPTFCPDCHRLVVGHNPKPGTGVTPPPTESEYKSKRDGNTTPSTQDRDR